ncbi:hypothetical protein SLOPH_864 [Spraguea lophii 42_110]|uniref:Uncharacterized protein n=1 Tax=Spraguea lophii (strain 42_110) TaxID=1358809 RepID=S7XJG9_SPRLO|nr:hypothetical protein SLOPH_864 [Spraguea lophii 42_110]
MPTSDNSPIIEGSSGFLSDNDILNTNGSIIPMEEGMLIPEEFTKNIFYTDPIVYTPEEEKIIKNINKFYNDEITVKKKKEGKKHFLKELNKFIKNIENNYMKRLSIIRTYLGELFLDSYTKRSNVFTSNTIDSIIDIRLNNYNIISNKQQLPSVYMGSNIKISKSMCTRSVENFLKKFHLDKQLKYPSVRNTKRMEQLKSLINKLMKKKDYVL